MFFNAIKQEKGNNSNPYDKVIYYKDDVSSVYKRKNTLMRTAHLPYNYEENMLNFLYLISPLEVLHIVNKTKFPSKCQHKYSSV